MSARTPVRRRARLAILVGVAAAALTLAAAAPAASPWSAPQAIPGAYMARWAPSGAGGFALQQPGGLLAFTPGGVGVAILGRDAGGSAITRFNGSHGTFGSLRASSFGGLAPERIAAYGRDGLLLAGRATDVAAPLNPQLLLNAAVTRGSSSGSFTRRQVLARGVVKGTARPAMVAALAANASGDAAVVVSVPIAGRRTVAGFQSRLFIRRRGQSSFRRVADIGPRTVGPSPAALAVNPPGDVLVAYDDRKSVSARLITASGKVGKTQRLGQGGSALRNDRMVAAMDATRRMLVAWMAQRVGEGNYAGSPGTVAIAYASPGKGFRPAQVVERGLPIGANRAIDGPAVQAALLRDRGVVLWTGFASGHTVVRTADVTNGRAGAPVLLSPAATGARLEGLAAGPRGGTVAVWFDTTGALGSTSPPPATGVSAAARPAGATAWGPVETVAAPAQGSPVVDAPVAASPVSGQTVLLFSDPLPPGPPPVTMAARFSLRAGP
ncbi:MAG: hypothetical protein ACXVFK_18405 [Solirubrobacteraceae bacterium]